jgi:hypothetical protein
MLQGPLWGRNPARLSSHFKQRTPSDACPAEIINPSTNKNIFQEQSNFSLKGKFAL